MRASKLLVVVCCLALCGCSIVEYFKPEKPPYDEQLLESYRQTELKTSNSVDVIAVIHMPAYEVLSQSKSVIASAGQKREGRKRWLNMVAFDEDELMAKRKYVFIIDESAKTALLQTKRKLKFDSEIVLGKDILDEPYANENARRIAILGQVLKNVREDVDEVVPDNKEIGICGMLINQTLESVIRTLNESPVLAAKLSDPNGVGFDHITLGEGRASMSVIDDIVSVEVNIDSSAYKFEDPFSFE